MALDPARDKQAVIAGIERQCVVPRRFAHGPRGDDRTFFAVDDCDLVLVRDIQVHPRSGRLESHRLGVSPFDLDVAQVFGALGVHDGQQGGRRFGELAPDVDVKILAHRLVGGIIRPFGQLDGLDGLVRVPTEDLTRPLFRVGDEELVQLSTIEHRVRVAQSRNRMDHFARPQVHDRDRLLDLGGNEQAPAPDIHPHVIQETVHIRQGNALNEPERDG